MDNSIEVRYAGVVVGRGALVRDLGDEGAFVGLAEPMPVGTAVTLKIGDAVREGRVEEVVESSDPSSVGMRVRWGGVARSAPAPQPASAPQPAPAPVVAGAAASAVAPPQAPVAPAPAAETGAAPVAEADDASGSLSAPMSLAGPSGDAHQGGGKRRRKRR